VSDGATGPKVKGQVGIFVEAKRTVTYSSMEIVTVLKMTIMVTVRVLNREIAQ
jgi:hypothetical protein